MTDYFSVILIKHNENLDVGSQKKKESIININLKYRLLCI